MRSFEEVMKLDFGVKYLEVLWKSHDKHKSKDEQEISNPFRESFKVKVIEPWIEGDDLGVKTV